MLYIIGAIFCILIVLFISMVIITGNGKMESAEYHPFKSAASRKKCLSAFTSIEKAQWPVTSEKKYIDTSFGKTFVRVSGPKDKPPLVLLHGNGGNSLMWSDSIKALSEKYRTYAVDRIDDFGLSIRSRDLKKPEEYVDWLDELFTNLRLGSDINLVGISYGAWLISQYALHHQNRLDKIVLISPASTIQPITKQFYVRAFLSVLPFRYFIRSFSSWLLEDLEKNNKPDFEKAVDFTYLLLRSYKIARAANPTVLDDSELQSITVPTMVLIGGNEKIYSVQKVVERLNRVAPHIKKEIIPGAGHDLGSVKSKLVNKKVLEFLRNK